MDKSSKKIYIVYLYCLFILMIDIKKVIQKTLFFKEKDSPTYLGVMG